MTAPMDNLDRSIVQAGTVLPVNLFVGLCGALSLFLLLTLTGCEGSSSSLPGSRPGAASPTRPGGGLPQKGVSSSATVRPQPPEKAIATLPSEDAPGSAVQTAASLVPEKEGATSPTDTAKPESSLSLPKSESSAFGVNPWGPAEKVELLGNAIELASAVIAAKANPFLDWLPKPLAVDPAASKAGGGGGVTIAPADPFEGVNLLGVVVQGKKIMALIAVGDAQTQFAEKGSVLALASGLAKVVAVRSDAVDLQLANQTAQTRTLRLPDIIGYSPNSAGASGSAMQGDGGSSAVAAGGAAENKTPSAIENIRTLLEQSVSAPGQSRESSGGSLNLQER